MMGGHRISLLAIMAMVALVAGACASASPPPESSRAAAAPPPPAPERAAAAPRPAPPPLPEAFESDDFVVTFAKAGDTAETLAKRYLGDADKAWMIQDYTGSQKFEPGQEIVIPRRPWNPSGVDATGYQ